MAKQKKEAEAQVEEQEVGLLDQILTEGKLARDEYQTEAAKDMIGEFVGSGNERRDHDVQEYGRDDQCTYR